MDTAFTNVPLIVFPPTTQDEIKRLVKKAANKTCRLDPMPTWLLKECLDTLLPIITCIVNKSITSGIVPSAFKRAVVRPLLKKPGLDKDEFKSYRPVSNLPFLSKILEKVVEARLDDHLLLNNLYDSHQSAYRRGHSTETALLKVQSDIADTLDHGTSVILIMLDLSAAFDTIDHNILLKRFSHSYGIRGMAQAWFRSYLTDPHQCIEIENSVSEYMLMQFGVPQGSVLGPKEYCMYAKPISNIICKYDLCYHCYADDTQIYLTIENNREWHKTKPIVEQCLTEINDWMEKNMLKLNQEKTEAIMFTPKKIDIINLQELVLDNATITMSQTVRNLGVTMDKYLSMESHINKIVQSSYLHIRNIWHIRKYLTSYSCKILVHGSIISRLDYCNSLLHGLPKKQITRLQKVQNSAARLICRVRIREHITPVLIHLHWLPVNSRIIYKILLLTYKCLHDSGPSYLKALLKSHRPSRTLRSIDKSLLAVPKSNHTRFSTRAFKHVAPNLWNGLPIAIKSVTSETNFKKQLKTHLFTLAYQ